MKKDMKEDINRSQLIIPGRMHEKKSPEQDSRDMHSFGNVGYDDLKSLLENAKYNLKSELKMINDIKDFIDDEYDSDNEDYMEQLMENTLRLSVSEENNCIETQKILAKISSLKPKKKDDFDEILESMYPEINAETIKYYVGKKPDFYYFRFPPLPKNYRGKSDTLAEMNGIWIKYRLSRIASYIKNTEDFTHAFEYFTIVFVHHITSKDTQFDTDNINIKKPIDGINGILIVNDSAARSHICQITETGEEEYTEMYVLEGHDLSGQIIAQIREKYVIA